MPAFRPDLFRGTARYYDRFRVPYPPQLIDDLSQRANVHPQGTLLDLACGTGLLAFALHERFAQTWAVDQEPDMIEVVRAKAAGTGSVHAVLSSAEEFDPAPGSFDLVVIGNAFHRMARDAVAARIRGWLRPGGHLALVWSDGPSAGGESWQRALRDCMNRWRVPDRIPAGYEQDRRERPDLVVLADAGFELCERREFSAGWSWTVESVTGCLLSTSVLSAAALGDQVAAFEADLRRSLVAVEPSGRFRQVVSSAYELVRPAQSATAE